VPALSAPAQDLARDVLIALAKAAVVLAVLTLVGPRVIRAWFGVIARRRSTELFVLNVLLITLLLAFLTGLAGLSLALGAFLAGMLLGETEYRYQVEEDIKPFRDVLLGLFFVTVGMMLDLRLVLGQVWLVLVFLAVLVAGKGALIALLARAFGAAPGTALRTALALAQGSEFGFVLLAQAQAEPSRLDLAVSWITRKRREIEMHARRIAEDGVERSERCGPRFAARPRKIVTKVNDVDRKSEPTELRDHAAIVNIASGRGIEVTGHGEYNSLHHSVASYQARARCDSETVTRIAASSRPSRPSSPARAAAARRSNT